jgi:thymidylate synthase (FAD)
MPPSFIVPVDLSPDQLQTWTVAIRSAEVSYKQLIAEGCTPQIARSVFPNALASRIVTTGNLRNWRHFLLMRTTREAHPQIRQVTIPLLAEFQEKFPVLFDDIAPLASQADNLKKMR